MQTVINAIKLLLLIGLGLAFFGGQGWLVIGPLIHGNLTKKKGATYFFEVIPLLLLGGIITNYGTTLVFQSLEVSIIIGSILSLIGICCFALFYFRFYAHRTLSPTSINKLVGAAFICLLFLSPILAEPLLDWDARSIWFFHAKMIFTAGSIGQSAGWQHLSLAYTHPDYPNLVPSIAAQVAYVVGFWNEYIPKLSLFFMLIPGVIWLFTFARRSISFVILLLLIPFSFFPWLWNGYMDGYLAFYFSIAMLLLGRYSRDSRSIDLISSVCCLFVLLNIKNEGAFAALTGLISIFIVSFFKKRIKFTRNAILKNWRFYFAGILALLPFMVWGYYKHQWNLSNDLGIGTSQSFSYITTRLTDDSYKLILKDVYKQVESALMLLGLLYFSSVAWKKQFAREGLPALVAAGIYCLGMILIYLLTPHDLVWQLKYSVSRTLLPVNGAIFISSYYILNKLENDTNGQVSGL